MDMYVRLAAKTNGGEGDNPTLGIILCTRKDQTIVQYSILGRTGSCLPPLPAVLGFRTEEEPSERMRGGCAGNGGDGRREV